MSDEMVFTVLRGLADSAVEAAQGGDPTGFSMAVSAIDAKAGWLALAHSVSDQFAAELIALLDARPPVGDCALLAKALYPYTSKVIAATPYDVEFLIRGYCGAPSLIAELPLHISLITQMAILGAVPNLEPLEFGQPSWDTETA